MKKPRASKFNQTPRAYRLGFEVLEERRVMTTELISSDSIGHIGTGNNSGLYFPVVSANGRYVAFDSDAANLITGDTNDHRDIFMKDTLSGITSLISSDSTGKQGNYNSYIPSISADGRYVAYYSYASNLVDGDTNNASDIFVKDSLTGITTLISTNSTGTQGNSDSYSSALSSDGRYVAFDSDASNLVIGDTNGNRDVFVKDTLTGIATLISTDSTGKQGNGNAFYPTISADGRYVAFNSNSSNLVAGDNNGSSDIFVKDTITGITTLISTDSTGKQGNDFCITSSISADGRYVAFESAASNLVAGDNNGNSDIFLKDTNTGATILISSDSMGKQQNSPSASPTISADGRYVTFFCYASNLVDGVAKGCRDIFVKDTITGIATLISTDSTDKPGNGDSYVPNISADARYVTFFSYASNLVPGDTNNSGDVFRVNNPLYPFETLTVTLTAGLLTIADLSNGGSGNTITLSRSGVNLVINEQYGQFDAAPAGGRLSHNNQTLTLPLAAITAGVDLETGPKDDVVRVDTSLAATLLKQGLDIDFGSGNDSLVLFQNKTNNVWTIDAANAGQVKVANQGTITFRGLENAAGGTGNDAFRIVSPDAMQMSLNAAVGGSDSLSVVRDADFTLTDSKLIIAGTALNQTFTLANIQQATLTGGAGNNFINAKDFSGSVRLNGGDGNDILWGGLGNDIINGGLGNDWLSGNGGDDTLLGWNGRDILIGGTGADKLNGGGNTGPDTGDDLLIGGTTSYDTDKTAIDFILTGWANPFIYSGHVTQFTVTGVGPKHKYKLNATTVFDDNASDILIGGTGNDWFFAGTSGVNKDTHDASGFEQVVGV